MLRAREVGMVGPEKIGRMLDATEFSDAAKLLIDCGYPDMSDMSLSQVDIILEKKRAEVFREISGFKYALDILDLFRIKYDYHNAKVLIKAAGANVDAAYLLSESGSIDAEDIANAFVSGQRGDLPPILAAAFDSAAGILSRTGNPQLSDIEIDKAYFNEITTIAAKLKHPFIIGYVRLLIDSANLRTIVRSARTGRDKGFLLTTLIPGWSIGIEQLTVTYEDSIPPVFPGDALTLASRLGADAMAGGSQTAFELACDNAVLHYVTDTLFIGFGPAPVIAYLAKLEWEITVVRMILTGKYTGIPADVIRERLRECHV